MYPSVSPATTGSTDRSPLPVGYTLSPKQYNAANDNEPGEWIPDCNDPQGRGVYIGLRRSAVEGRNSDVVTVADLIGINYADDESEPVVPVLSDADWQRHAAETDFAFRQFTQPERHGDFMQTATGRKF